MIFRNDPKDMYLPSEKTRFHAISDDKLIQDTVSWLSLYPYNTALHYHVNILDYLCFHHKLIQYTSNSFTFRPSVRPVLSTAIVVFELRWITRE